MKKLFCLVPAIALWFLTNAQQTTFGVKAGLNVSSVEVEEGEDYTSKTGLHLGGLAHIHITRQFALQPELVYSMQGGKDGDRKLKLNYFNIPILAQYMTQDGLRLQTGPQIGFLAAAESESGDVEIDVKDNLSSVDFSWTIGAGYLFPSGFGIDARYNLGISNVRENESAEARNRVFQVGVFYQFMQTGKSIKRK